MSGEPGGDWKVAQTRRLESLRYKIWRTSTAPSLRGSVVGGRDVSPKRPSFNPNASFPSLTLSWRGLFIANCDEDRREPVHRAGKGRQAGSSQESSYRPNQPKKDPSMKTLRLLVYPLALLGCALFLTSCKTTAPSAQGGTRDTLYVCGCGPDCKCTSVSTKAGTCGCGKVLVAGHLKKVEGDVGQLCMCDPGCKCALDAKDPTKCGCGKPLRKVSLKGSGIYFCNCGGSCTCNTVSDQPAKCKCGMDLKRAD